MLPVSLLSCDGCMGWGIMREGEMEGLVMGIGGSMGEGCVPGGGAALSFIGST